jgi:hypothetical protein
MVDYLFVTDLIVPNYKPGEPDLQARSTNEIGGG